MPEIDDLKRGTFHFCATGRNSFMNRLELFNQHRLLLFAIAYRMLGSVADAEDMVQEAFLRWQQASDQKVQSPKAYLSAIVTRLCIDHLRSAQREREQYVGTWLPEPLGTPQIANTADFAELAESLSIAFLFLLERLSPIERAVFLLREVFDYDYIEIGKIVDKSAANCRQIMHRARQNLSSRPPRYNSLLQQQEQVVEQFLQAWIGGDLQTLLALMTEDITSWSDGGGKVVAALKPLHGSGKVARFLLAIRSSKILPTLTSHLAQINGQLGIINYTDRYPHSVVTFDFSDDCRIRNIFAVVNPEKLKWVI